MTRKKRKSLDDSLANEFVFGGEQPETEETPTPEVEEEVTAAEKESPPIAPMEKEKPSDKPNKELSLMDKLQVQPKEATKRFTVDLPESMHRKLSILSAKSGRTKADIIRMVLDDVLADVEE